jgi:ribosomal protein L35AE/L33A
MGRLIATVLALALALAQGSVRVENLAGTAVDPLVTPKGVKAIVFLFTSTDCPISNRYVPELRRLAQVFVPQGVMFRLVYPNPAEDAAAIRTHMAAFAYAGAIDALRDPKHALVKLSGATITPEAAVYAGGRVQYRGRIDNRFVDFGVDRPAATEHDLHDAIGAILAGKPVAHPETQAVGCYIADFAR